MGDLLVLGPWFTIGLTASRMLLSVLVDAQLACEEQRALRILAVAVLGVVHVPQPALLGVEGLF